MMTNNIIAGWTYPSTKMPWGYWAIKSYYRFIRKTIDNKMQNNWETEQLLSHNFLTFTDFSCLRIISETRNSLTFSCDKMKMSTLWLHMKQFLFRITLICHTQITFLSFSYLSFRFHIYIKLSIFILNEMFLFCNLLLYVLKDSEKKLLIYSRKPWDLFKLFSFTHY